MMQYTEWHLKDNFRIYLHKGYLQRCVLELRSEWIEATTHEKVKGRAFFGGSGDGCAKAGRQE